MPPQLGPHEQPPAPSSVHVSPAMQSPLHIGALLPQLTACAWCGNGIDNPAAQASSTDTVRHILIANPSIVDESYDDAATS